MRGQRGEGFILRRSQARDRNCIPSIKVSLEGRRDCLPERERETDAKGEELRVWR